MDKNGPDLSDLLAPVLARLDAIEAAFAALRPPPAPTGQDADIDEAWRVATGCATPAVIRDHLHRIDRAAYAQRRGGESLSETVARVFAEHERVESLLTAAIARAERAEAALSASLTERAWLTDALANVERERAQAEASEQRMGEECDAWRTATGCKDPGEATRLRASGPASDAKRIARARRDGGQYVDTHGVAKAATDAEVIVVQRMASPPVAIDAGAPPPVDAARALLIEYLSRRNADNPCNPTFEECEAGPRERAVEDMRRALATIGATVATPRASMLTAMAEVGMLVGLDAPADKTDREAWNVYGNEVRAAVKAALSPPPNDTIELPVTVEYEDDGRDKVTATIVDADGSPVARMLTMDVAGCTDRKDAQAEAIAAALNRAAPVATPGEAVAWGVEKDGRLVYADTSRSDVASTCDEDDTIVPLYRATAPGGEVTVSALCAAYAEQRKTGRKRHESWRAALTANAGKTIARDRGWLAGSDEDGGIVGKDGAG